ncbi:MAG: uracil-DNA glycosylase family protein [Candidatus Microsaccharimonas sp.]
MIENLDAIRAEIIADPANEDFTSLGLVPIYTASKDARIMIVGQAPGRKAQASETPWNDASGDTLRGWLGVTREVFYDPAIFALVPMDFYYPGKGKQGDLPPRKGFAEKWHPRILKQMPNIELIILVGSYAQKYYLGKNVGKSLAETLLQPENHSRLYLPLVHPSPLTIGWRARNRWFEGEIVPALKVRIQEILNPNHS